MITASAPGKIILFGEHAVVYGHPAIAVPVSEVRATATIVPAEAGSGCILELPDVQVRLRVPPIGRSGDLHWLHALTAEADREVPAKHAPPPDLGGRLDRSQSGENTTATWNRAVAGGTLAQVVQLTWVALQIAEPPDWVITLRSTIPVASGLGSGAAAAAALVRAVAAAMRRTVTAEQVSALVFESEKQFHGTPSGIDNTVIAHEQPVWFVRGQQPQPFAIGRPFAVVIADSGIASPTSVTVGDVRRGWQKDPAHYEALFEQIGALVQKARQAIEMGNLSVLGELMDANHRLLQALFVSSPELDSLQAAAKEAGALGAKLSGGGRGGNLIALAPGQAGLADDIAAQLREHGAARALVTQVRAQHPTP